MSHNNFAKCHILLFMRSRLKVLISKCICVTVKVPNKNSSRINITSENYQKHKCLKRLFTNTYLLMIIQMHKVNKQPRVTSIFLVYILDVRSHMVNSRENMTNLFD